MPHRSSLLVRWAWTVLLALVATAWAGCASVPRHAGHYIVVHKDGYPIIEDDPPPGPGTKGDEGLGKTYAQFRSAYIAPILAGIDAYVSREASAGRTPRLLLFVHGGLNTYRGALQHVDTIMIAQGDGRHPQLAQYHLLAITWDSSLWSSLLDDLARVRLGERRPLVGIPTAPFITAARAAESGLLAPQTLGALVGNAVQGSAQAHEKDWQWCAPEPKGPRKQAADLANLGPYFLFYPLRALSVPGIQGLGGPAWDMMKRRAELVVAREKALRRRDPKAAGAGWVLTDALRDRIPAMNQWRIPGNPDQVKPLEITLIGHSMGTMVLNRILTEFTQVHFHRIIYLAAAATIGDVEAALLPYLHHHPLAQFWSLSLAEALEAEEINGLDLYGRGSLLVWVDDLFERVGAPADRTFGRARNLRLYFALPEDSRDEPGKPRRVFLVKFDMGRDDPRTHADFTRADDLERILRMVGREKCRIIGPNASPGGTPP